MAREAGRLGLPIQINTLVAKETAADLPAIYELLKTFPVMRWSLFFLISVGRGKALQEVSPARGEEIMHWVLDLVPDAPFAVKTTEAPSYRRLALNHMHASGRTASEIKSSSVYNGFQIRDGHGIVFVSNQGDIYPSGFLPLDCGNVRTGSLVNVYRHAPLFQALHSPQQFRGRCGVCEFSHICGGSRARAFAHTGDALESDPLCLYRQHERLNCRPSASPFTSERFPAVQDRRSGPGRSRALGRRVKWSAQAERTRLLPRSHLG